MEEKETKVASLQAANDDLLRRLEEAEKMLNKSDNHKVMTKKINDQKKVTRDALSYVAEINRERSIFATPHKASQSQFETVSVEEDLV